MCSEPIGWSARTVSCRISRRTTTEPRCPDRGLPHLPGPQRRQWRGPCRLARCHRTSRFRRPPHRPRDLPGLGDHRQAPVAERRTPGPGRPRHRTTPHHAQADLAGSEHPALGRRVRARPQPDGHRWHRHRPQRHAARRQGRCPDIPPHPGTGPLLPRLCRRPCRGGTSGFGWVDDHLLGHLSGTDPHRRRSPHPWDHHDGVLGSRGWRSDQPKLEWSSRGQAPGRRTVDRRLSDGRRPAARLPCPRRPAHRPLHPVRGRATGGLLGSSAGDDRRPASARHIDRCGRAPSVRMCPHGGRRWVTM